MGRGKFSTVYKARRRADGRVVALKRIRMGAATVANSAVQEKCLKEVRLLQSLDHGNIIRYLDSFAVHPNTLVIVLEWATDGDLQCHLRRIRDRGGALPEPVIWQSFVQICEALAHMHERRILHRDLKPANIFLHRDGTIKVGDLGLGRTLSDDTPEAFSKVGTPLYMSPEALRGDGYDMKSDIWSLGCVLYELAMLRSPFKEEGLKMFQLFEKIVKCDYKPLPGGPDFDQSQSLSLSTSTDANVLAEAAESSAAAATCPARGFSEDLRYLTSCMICRDPSHRPDIWHTLRYASAQLERIREANGGAAVMAAAAAAAEVAAHQHQEQQQQQQIRSVMTARERALVEQAYEMGADAAGGEAVGVAAQKVTTMTAAVRKRNEVTNVDENSSVGSNMRCDEGDDDHSYSDSASESMRYNGEDAAESYEQYLDSQSYEDYEGYDDDDDDDDVIALDVVEAAKQLQNDAASTVEMLKKVSLSKQGRDVFSQSLSADDLELESVRLPDGTDGMVVPASITNDEHLPASASSSREGLLRGQTPILVKNVRSPPQTNDTTSRRYGKQARSSPPPIAPMVARNNSIVTTVGGNGEAGNFIPNQTNRVDKYHPSHLQLPDSTTHAAPAAASKSSNRSVLKIHSSKLPRTTGATPDNSSSVLRPLNLTLQQAAEEHREHGKHHNIERFSAAAGSSTNVSASSNSVGFAKHHRSRSVPELRPMPGQKGTTETQVGVPMSSAVVDCGGFRATIGTSTPITRSSSNPNARRQRRGDMQGQYGKGSFTRRSATPILTPLDRTPSPFKSSASQPSLVLGADGLGVTDLMGRKLKLPRGGGGGIQLSPRADLPVPRISPAQHSGLELPGANYGGRSGRKMVSGWTVQGKRVKQ